MGKTPAPRNNNPNKQREQDRLVREHQMISDLRNQLGLSGTPTEKQLDDIKHKSYHLDPEYIAQGIRMEAEEKAKADAISKTHKEMDKKLDDQR
jgi:hypothetical protein